MTRSLIAWGLALAIVAPSAQAGPGHNHGEEEALPTVSLEDLRPRAQSVGTWYEFVAMPIQGALAIFLDDADTNAPVIGAQIELLTVSDTPLVAKETVPGMYLAAPWPPVDVDPEALRGSDMVVTVIVPKAEDLLVVALPDAVVDATIDNGIGPAGNQIDPMAETKSAAVLDRQTAVIVAVIGGLIALIGLAVGLGRRGGVRWLGFSATVAGLVLSAATTTLI